MQFKVGIGYDVHRLIKGKKLFLGGVPIPYSKGLQGHSDADVVLHAICDAILGALGQGDIGEHFPNTDPRFKGISSLKLLKSVSTLVKKQGYKVNNVDAIIVAEEPSLKAFKGQMRSHIADGLAIEETAVNIKATTSEGMGFIGRRQGMAAYATVSIAKK